MPVLHGAPIEIDVCTEWYTVGDLKANFKSHQPPLYSDGNQYSNRLEHDALLSKTIHLIEIDSMTSDSVCTHATLNDRIHCDDDDKCQCKSHVLHETKGLVMSSQLELTCNKQQDVLPPVPICTKLGGDEVKQQVMDLYPDLFADVGTIKNAMAHLDVKPGAVPVVCEPLHVCHAIQSKLKDEY